MPLGGNGILLSCLSPDAVANFESRHNQLLSDDHHPPWLSLLVLGLQPAWNDGMSQ